MRQQIKHILAILLFVLGTASLQAQSVDVQLVYNNTADVDASLSNLVKVDELKEAIQANGHIDQNLIVRIAFFDKNVVGQMMLNAEHKLSIDDYVSKWQKMVENKNAVLFLFVKQYENDTYEFNKMHLSGKLSKHFLSSVIELIDKQLTGDNNEIIAKGTHYLAEAIKFILTKEKMEQATELTPFEIKICREYIKTLKDDVAKQEALYLALQKKVPYHNQRDNDPTYKNMDKNGNIYKVQSETDRHNEADAMCNLTSTAMALEMLGISKEDALQKLKDDGFDVSKESNKDFEDILDVIRVNKGFNYSRTNSELWKQIANYLGIKTKIVEVHSSNIDGLELSSAVEEINKALSEGNGVVMSMYNNRGHIVRVQSIDKSGVIIDDPFGNVTDMAKRELIAKSVPQSSFSGGANNRTPGCTNGKGYTISWNEINVSKNVAGRGGDFEVRGNEIYKTIKRKDGKPLDKKDWIDHYVKDWVEKLPVPGRNEYVTKTETGNKTDRDNNVVNDDKGKPITENITYYTSYGGMIKFFVIFYNKNN